MNNEFINADEFAKTFSLLQKMLANSVNNIISICQQISAKVIGIISKIDFNKINKRLSRKRFIKLLMSNQIQRNNANKIADYYFNKQGYYCLFDLIRELDKE